MAEAKLAVLYPEEGDLTLKPLVIFEQLNPPKGYRVTVDKLEAVHGVLGVIPKNEAQIVSKAAAEYHICQRGGASVPLPFRQLYT